MNNIDELIEGMVEELVGSIHDKMRKTYKDSLEIKSSNSVDNGEGEGDSSLDESIKPSTTFSEYLEIKEMKMEVSGIPGVTKSWNGATIELDGNRISGKDFQVKNTKLFASFNNLMKKNGKTLADFLGKDSVLDLESTQGGWNFTPDNGKTIFIPSPKK